jgi:hypothetical protein
LSKDIRIVRSSGGGYTSGKPTNWGVSGTIFLLYQDGNSYGERIVGVDRDKTTLRFPPFFISEDVSKKEWAIDINKGFIHLPFLSYEAGGKDDWEVNGSIHTVPFS